MFDIYCQHCHRPQLLSTSQILSTHHTADGPIAYVRCSEGHHLVKEFRANRTRSLEAWASVYRRPA